MIIWIMGLNGAGKSSVAKELEKILARYKIQSLVLDGNHLREVFEQNSYDRASRIALGIRYANLAKSLVSQDKVIIIAANGMLSEVCSYNRTHLSDYIEIFLDVPLEVLRQRDSGGIYSKFEAGLIHNVGGLDLEIDTPNAHLHIPYAPHLSPSDIAQKIFAFIEDKKTQKDLPKAITTNSILSTKAQTLKNLSTKLKTAQVLPLWILRKDEFENQKTFHDFLQKLHSSSFERFVVRSSAKSEDTATSSNAGAYESLLDVRVEDMREAIECVFASYERHSVLSDKLPRNEAEVRRGDFSQKAELLNSEEVLIQPMAQNIIASGVAFSIQPKSSAPYYVVEYSLESTHAITSGESNTQTFYIAKDMDKEPKDTLLKHILALLKELEELIPNTPLDVEFGISKEHIYCFQVRPLVIQEKQYPSHTAQLKLLHKKISTLLAPNPRLYGTKGILGVMPDWNPAEIIGLHPKALSFSLYKNLITDSIYASERARYGYKDISSNPLIFNLHGKPYVDVRASFNSFIPNDLDKSLSKKLVDYYLNQLRANPQWHDKVEFEILFDSYYFDTPKALAKLEDFGFSSQEIANLTQSLKNVSNTIIGEKIYQADREKIKILGIKREQILKSNLPILEKIYWLLADCKNYGTSAFVGLARIGFMAMSFLNALVKEGILSKAQKDNFITSLECVTSHLSQDAQSLEKSDFLRKYGHLRPGTYDILSPSYEEGFEFYFGKNNNKKRADCVHIESKNTESSNNYEPFSLTLSQMKEIDYLLKTHNIKCDVICFFDFIATGIIERENSKFEFSKNLSQALNLIGKLGESYGLSKEDMSYCDVDIFFKAYSASNNLERLILESIEQNKSTYALQQSIILPPLILDEDDVFVFSSGECMPNFITQKRIKAAVIRLDNNQIHTNSLDLRERIVCISRADPGFDWIFSHNIAGFITEFGGANSHMAIRANELSIPAVIGCGTYFEKWANAAVLEIDCANSKVEMLS